MSKYFSQKLTVFHGRILPEKGFLVGYGLLIKALESQCKLDVPLPETLAIATDKHQRYDTENWKVFTIRHKPSDDLKSHLVFALKYEALDLFILKKFFQTLGKEIVITMLEEEPTGQYTRRAWFLYEWLLGEKLNVPDLKRGTYVAIVDDSMQFTKAATNSTRHRVKNNLPGTPEYCPMIRKTKTIEQYIGKGLSEAIEIGLGKRNKDLVRRTAAFLLLKDSKASFAIEGEYPPNMRARNWGKAIGLSGKTPLTIEEIERLQDIVIGSKKLRNMGLRKGEGFIGEHDSETFTPMPDHISASAKDLPSLMHGLLETNAILQAAGYDPVLAAATISFGFVFIHPLSDGNGRIHRYLIHHILTRMGYTKRGVIFPVSSAILDRIDEYQDILEDFSSPRIDLIQWKETPDHNVEILNETGDLYRYFDLTKQAEFIYSCVADTIEKIIPEELDYLEKYDHLTKFINDHITLPDNEVDLLIKFLNQNQGKLSKNKREKHFEELKDEEVKIIEGAFQDIFMES
ncbi:Fic/DOC family protein [Arenibacter nanhaiticus]|uniref:Fic/DOC family protein n=1 Tax=Arenibacter nanhaiticus TaxID=558155 RepID=A0A1M6MJV7_9FLAO|nr:Fic family protein [Arenibacter nanhaiticus]SHJ83640.1 Fic/DOC family protein [Arenibacter nanhaiticus]